MATRPGVGVTHPVGGMLTFGILIFALMMALLQLASAKGGGRSGEEGCHFPKKWHGDWYQNRLGDVRIRNRTISSKGTCREHKRALYLLQRTKDGVTCNICIFFMFQHRNLIQYRESFCLPNNNFHEVCDQLYQRIESPLFTLVRENSRPEPDCPFQPAYSFVYNNNTSGYCANPSSSVRACAADSKFSFRFHHCNDMPDTYDRELQFECLAKWKAGSDYYLYGGFSGRGVISRDDTYRCFMYKSLEPEMQLSMSADASCLGLRSPQDGPLVMDLTRDTEHWPEPTCRFPAWLRGTTWRDLAGQHLYHYADTGHVLSVSFRRHSNQRAGHISMNFRCIKLIEDDSEQFMAVSFSTHGCASYNQCIRIRKINHDVIEISEGQATDSSILNCSSVDMDKTMRLLFPDNKLHAPCPYQGRYSEVQTDVTSCTLRVHSGCNGTHMIKIDNTCTEKSIGDLECYSSWFKEDIHFVIAARADDQDHVANCFSFRREGSQLRFETSGVCNVGVNPVLGELMQTALLGTAAPCNAEESHLFMQNGSSVITPVWNTILVSILLIFLFNSRSNLCFARLLSR